MREASPAYRNAVTVCLWTGYGRGLQRFEMERDVIRRVSLGFVIWLVIGLIVAGNRNFLRHLDTVSRVLSAILAVLAWPLVLFNIHIAI
jgi:ABC-type anion transport system duplicated permease subunit